jgi:hypothetical protein
MNNAGTAILLIGLAVLVVAQLYVTLKTFGVSPVKGMLCLVIPGYALLIAKRYGFYSRFFLAYLAGILGIVIGGSMLS